MTILHVYDCQLERHAALLARASDHLPDDEQARAARFKVAAAREEYLLSRLLLRRVLAEHLGRAPGPFAYGAQGKPTLPGGGLEFNLSHSRGRLLIAVSADFPVGIDIERVDPAIDPIALAHAGLTAGDVQSLLAAPQQMRHDLFHRLWTRREACLKALGTGLGGMVGIVARRALGDDAECLEFAAGGLRVQVRGLPAADGFRAAVALVGCEALSEIVRREAP